MPMIVGMSFCSFFGAACAISRHVTSPSRHASAILYSVGVVRRRLLRRVCVLHRKCVRCAACAALGLLSGEGRLTIVSTSMVASTTMAATASLSSMLRPVATSMVSMVSMMPPTQKAAACTSMAALSRLMEKANMSPGSALCVP